MKERHASSPGEVKKMTTEQLRESFLMQQLFVNGKISFVYSHYDRMITGGVVPAAEAVSLQPYEQLKASFFLERREMGVINIGGEGKIVADGAEYTLQRLDCLYIGRGTKEVTFSSSDAARPARFYVLSAPAHQTFPTTLMKSSEASPTDLGAAETANERTIYKYIHEKGIQSSQLVMGLTRLKPGNVWNTMPAHTHNRRMEVYLYFDVQENQRVLHLMGEPQESRHLVMANEEAVISAPWSMHAGCGTANYSFIWGMAGENKDYADMDAVDIKDLK